MKFHKPHCASLQNVSSNKRKDIDLKTGQTFMKKLLLILFALQTIFSFGQKKQYDTLFFANKKYLLEIGQTIGGRPYNFPFVISEYHYKDLYTKKYYTSIDEYSCIDGAQFTASGNEIISYKCKDFKTKQYCLDNFVDSVTLDANDFGKIFVKTSTGKYLIEKIQFKLVFDSTLLIVNPDINQLNEDFAWQIREALYKVKPKFIVLNEMLYTDKTKKLQLIPRQFIFTLK